MNQAPPRIPTYVPKYVLKDYYTPAVIFVSAVFTIFGVYIDEIEKYSSLSIIITYAIIVGAVVVAAVAVHLLRQPHITRNQVKEYYCPAVLFVAAVFSASVYFDDTPKYSPFIFVMITAFVLAITLAMVVGTAAMLRLRDHLRNDGWTSHYFVW